MPLALFFGDYYYELCHKTNDRTPLQQFRQRRTPAITNGVVSLAATSAGVVVPIVISGFAVAAGVIATKVRCGIISRCARGSQKHFTMSSVWSAVRICRCVGWRRFPNSSWQRTATANPYRFFIRNAHMLLAACCVCVTARMPMRYRSAQNSAAATGSSTHKSSSFKPIEPTR